MESDRALDSIITQQIHEDLPQALRRIESNQSFRRQALTDQCLLLAGSMLTQKFYMQRRRFSLQDNLLRPRPIELVDGSQDGMLLDQSIESIAELELIPRNFSLVEKDIVVNAQIRFEGRVKQHSLLQHRQGKCVLYRTGTAPLVSHFALIV